MTSPLELSLSHLDLPVIDISEFPQDLSHDLRENPLLLKLRKACQEWGFFQVINHGIPADLVERADKVSRDLLSLPAEMKDRATTGNRLHTYSRIPSFEGFRFSDSTNPASIEDMCAKVCPQGIPIFCETIAAYVLSVSNLEQRIRKIMLASLGLDANAFYASHFDKCTSVLRVNGYPTDKISVGEEALFHHTDLGCLTILYQDGMGGLEIRSQEGEWFNVKPLPHSFVVNLGDSINAWSNGRYRSAEHRVVYNGWRERISIGFFSFFPEETEIWAPEELVDEENPRAFKPFIFSHFRNHVMDGRADKERATALKQFAGSGKRDSFHRVDMTKNRAQHEVWKDLL